MNSLAKTLLCLMSALPAAYATSVLQGDTSGNTRGADSIDIQSQRGSPLNVASGSGSVAVGLWNSSSGPSSVSFGLGNNVAAEMGVAFGMGNTIQGPLQYFEQPPGAFGLYNSISPNSDGSYAFGRGNSISAVYATAFGNAITNSTANSTMIGPSDTAKVTILSNGNVGIGLGSTGPAARLDVGGGDIRLSGNIIKAGGGTVVLPTSGTLTLPATGGSLVTTSGTQTITGTTTLGGNSTAQQVKIDSSGSVGVGTAAPGARLSVVDSSPTEVGIHVQNTATTGYSAIRLGTDSLTSSGTALHDFGSGFGGSGAYGPDQTTLTAFRPNGLSLHANANAPVKFFTGGNASANERMRIDGTGNVGIGTGQAALSEKLNVVGGNFYLKDAAGTGGWIKGVDDNHSIYFREGGADRINYYEYGGLLSQGKGHRFYTGGAKSSQGLRLQIADDLSNFTGNVSVQGSLAMEGLESRPIMARGGAYAVGSRKVLFKGTESVPTAYGALSVRGLAVMVIDRTTLTVDSHINYDCFAVDAERTAMASALNALGSDKFVVITSTDAWSANASLKTALLRVGASPVALEAVNQSPYALIGIPGIGAGNGLEAYNEVINGTPLAGVTTFFVRPTAETSGQFDIAGRKDNTFVKNDGSVYFNTPVAINGSLAVNGSPVVPSSGGNFTGGVTVTSDSSTTGGLTLGSGTASDGANLRLVSSSTPQWNLDNYYGSLRFFSETAPNSGGVVVATINSDKSFRLNDGTIKIIGSGSPQYTGTFEMVGGGDEVLKIYGAPRISLDPWGSNVPHGKVNITPGGLAINTSTSASTNILSASAALQIEASTTAAGGIWLGGAKLYTPNVNQFNLEMQQPLFQVVSDGMAGPSDAVISGRGSGSGANSGEFQLIAGQAANTDGAAFHTKVGGVRTMTQSTQTVSIVPTTSSTSATTGALVVAGGAGIAGNVNVGGNLTVSGSGTLTVSSITLPDGAISSSKTKTLYDASGTAVATVDGSGKVNFINGVSFGTNPAATLTPNSAAYLAQTLTNLGFKETATASTSVSTIPLNNATVVVNDLVRSSGYTYVTGYVAGAASIGGQSLTSNWGSTDGFVAKLNASGGVEWTRVIGGKGADILNALSVDSAGNVYAAGQFFGTTTSLYSEMGADINLVSAGGNDGIIIKINSAGGLQWAKAVGGVSDDGLTDVCAVPGGGAAVAGFFGGTTSTLVAPALNQSPAGGQDGIVVKYDANGISQWARTVGSTAGDRLEGVSTDSANNIYVAGSAAGAVTTLTDLSPSIATAGSTDGIVIKFSGSGGTQWARMVGGTGADGFYGMLPDSSSGIYIGGNYTAATTNLPSNLASAGGCDGMLIKLDPSNGTVSWARSVGSAGFDNINKVVSDGLGNIVAAGGYSGIVDLPSPVADLVGPGMTDVMLLRYTSSGTLTDGLSIGGASGDTITGLDVAGTDILMSGQNNGEAGAYSIGDIRIPRGNYIARWSGFVVSTAASGPVAALNWGASAASSSGVALGSGAYASGAGSSALGSGSATKTFSFSAGSGSATGLGSSALGVASMASGDYSAAFGNNTRASGNNSLAFGNGSIAAGTGSFAGGGAQATGTYSFALGTSSSVASGVYSKTIGLLSTASGSYATAFGLQSKAVGSYSTVIGSNLTANTPHEFIIGRYNVPLAETSDWVATGNLLVLGNGTNTNAQSNALVVQKNGNTRVAGIVEAKGGFRTPRMGDIDMGEFTAGPNPGDSSAGLNAGLRYPGE